MSANTNNSSLKAGFHLMAFSSFTKWQFVIFTWVLSMYLQTVLGNLVIITLVCLVPRLQTPMYFFLCNLAGQDIVYVSAILPKLLAITMTGDTSISFTACITQIFLFAICVDVEFFLLAVMAYDRYVAICTPLHYTLVMNKRVCYSFAVTCWVTYFLNALLYSLLISNISFCRSQVSHFFCDIKSMLKLSCSDITHIQIIIYMEWVFVGFLPFVLTLASYVCIISTILKIRTSAGRLKTFSSCSSHLTVVILFCGTSLGLYMKPESENVQDQEMLLSILYIAIVPMLNPIVYSLRNKDVWAALKTVAKNLF